MTSQNRDPGRSALENDGFVGVVGNPALRDYFAGKAMQALISRPGDSWPDGVDFDGAYGTFEDDTSEGDQGGLPNTVAMAAYEYADAMLVARKKATQNGGIPDVTEMPTLRDYFAVEAMQARISRAEDDWLGGQDFRSIYAGDEDDGDNEDRLSSNVIARVSYHFADAMLISQRKKNR